MPVTSKRDHAQKAARGPGREEHYENLVCVGENIEEYTPEAPRLANGVGPKTNGREGNKYLRKQDTILFMASFGQSLHKRKKAHSNNVLILRRRKLRFILFL